MEQAQRVRKTVVILEVVLRIQVHQCRFSSFHKLASSAIHLPEDERKKQEQEAKG
jgi:hypothetical protein